MTHPADRVQELFEAAILLATAEARSALIDRECGADDAFRRQLERLLRAHDEDKPFLATTAADMLLQSHEELQSETLRATGDSNTFPPASLPQSQVRLRDPDSSDRHLLANESSTEIPPTRQVGHYEVAGEIARGGMGAVFWARDTLLGRDLAIKVLLNRHRHNTEMVRRFIQEAQIAGQLQTPGIAPVHEIGRLLDGRPFYSMKLIRGDTLQSVLSDRQHDPSTLQHLLRIFLEVCQTVAYAHRRGVVHRDLKPANIMVGAFGEVQVMDWGLAKQIGDDHDDTQSTRTQATDEASLSSADCEAPPSAFDTNDGMVMGTPAYMSPEMARGRASAADERTDVFSLGAILCEILIGRPPYAGDRAVQDAIAHQISDCHTRLEQSDADPSLISLVRNCLQEAPSSRVSSVEQISEQITNYLEGTVIDSASLNVTEGPETHIERADRRYDSVFVVLTIVMLASTWWILSHTAGANTTPVVENNNHRGITDDASQLTHQRTSAPEKDSRIITPSDAPAEPELDLGAAQPTVIPRLVKTERVFTFENRQRTGKFLDIDGNESADFRLVPLADYTPQGGCHWKLVAVNEHCFRIKNMARDVYLNVHGEEPSAVITTGIPENGEDEWNFMPLGDDCFHVVSEYWASRDQKRVLSIDESGTPVLETEDTGPQSEWRLTRYPHWE